MPSVSERVPSCSNMRMICHTGMMIIWCACLYCFLPAVSSLSTELWHRTEGFRSASRTTPFHHVNVASCKRMIRKLPTSLGATSLTSPKNQDQTGQNTESQELLRLLQHKASVAPNTQSTNNNLDKQINALVRSLSASKITFDPTRCLNGPLYATVHFVGDTPLWERIAVRGVRNVKGQRYTLTDDTSGEFVNYAEIWGRKFYLKAVGKFYEKGSVSSSFGTDANPSNNPFEFMAPLFSNLQGKKERLKTTPYDYEAIVNGASIVLFQKYSFDVAIAGTGTVRVLYADPNIRIFLSPTDTNVTTGGGDWESAGLIVVQVRCDLLYRDCDDLLLGD